MATRSETDSMGAIESTPRATGRADPALARDFRIGGERMPHEIIHALAQIKKASALVNRDLGLLPDAKAQLIVAAADEVLDGQHADEFPLVCGRPAAGRRAT